jgi:hypothetical protein
MVPGVVQKALEGIMDLERVKKNAKESTDEDLLDRVTVYRAGIEEPALEVLEQELRSRGVTDEQVEAHREMSRNVLWEKPGLAWRCGFCDRPAVVELVRWHRLLGIFPLFPRLVRCCREHGG